MKRSILLSMLVVVVLLLPWLRVSRAENQEVVLFDGPRGGWLATVRGDVPLETLEERDGWRRVRLEGWIAGSAASGEAPAAVGLAAAAEQSEPAVREDDSDPAAEVAAAAGLAAASSSVQEDRGVTVSGVLLPTMADQSSTPGTGLVVLLVGELDVLSEEHAAAGVECQDAMAVSQREIDARREDYRKEMNSSDNFREASKRNDKAKKALKQAERAHRETIDECRRTADAVFQKHAIRRAISDMAGRFEFDEVPNGEFRVVASEIGGTDLATFIAGLKISQRLELFRATSTLSSAETHRSFRAVVGEVGYRMLVKGPKDDDANIIGRALLQGRYPARNISGAFKVIYNAQSPDAPAFTAPITLPENKNDFEYLMLEGLFGQNVPGYMEINAEALRDSGVRPQQTSFARYNTTNSAYVSAATIAAQIVAKHRQSGRRTVLMTHSMGGRHAQALLSGTREDFAAAAIDDEQWATVLEARDCVAGSLLMQPAFNAQIAHDINGTALLDPVYKSVLKLVGGSTKAFEDMANEALKAPFPGEKYPTVVIASDAAGPFSMLAPLVELYYQKLYGVPSDGAVPTAEQIAVSGADLIYLPNAGDHVRPGLNVRLAIEHVAKQLDAGEPDEIAQEVLERLVDDCPMLGVLLSPLEKGLEYPWVRNKVARDLRNNAPKIDDFLRSARLKAGVETLDPKRGTQVAMKLLLDKIAG